MLKEKMNSPLISLLWRIGQMRNEKRDYLIGRVLTFLESIISNEKQLKASKDIVKSIFYEKTYHWELEKVLKQFSNKFCPDIEKGCKYKLNNNETEPLGDQSYFSDK